MDKAIVEFINEHHLLTLATSNNNEPYCCNAFYVFDKENRSLIFSSDTTSRTEIFTDYLRKKYHLSNDRLYCPITNEKFFFDVFKFLLTDEGFF